MFFSAPRRTGGHNHYNTLFLLLFGLGVGRRIGALGYIIRKWRQQQPEHYEGALRWEEGKSPIVGNIINVIWSGREGSDGSEGRWFFLHCGLF